MKIFISGVTGTLGQMVSSMLVARGHEVVGYSRDEQKQAKMPKHDMLTLYLGDVRDRDRVIEATRDCDLIMHFAANKMVDILEHNPEEALHTNVIGTQNILHAQRVNGIDRVVLASTDKAVYPINIYGASKMAAERLVLRNPNNVVCRYGNVLGSRGSVLPMFVKTLQAEDPYAEITDIKMTRFWITAERAAGFVISTALDDSACGLKIPRIESAKVSCVIDTVAEILDVKGFIVHETEIRPGEKIHECLLTEAETADGIPVYSNDKEMSEEALHELIGEALRSL